MRSKWPTRANRKPIPGPQQLSSSQSSSPQGASTSGGGAAQRLASTSAALREGPLAEGARLPAAARRICPRRRGPPPRLPPIPQARSISHRRPRSCRRLAARPSSPRRLARHPPAITHQVPSLIPDFLGVYLHFLTLSNFYSISLIGILD